MKTYILKSLLSLLLVLLMSSTLGKKVFANDKAQSVISENPIELFQIIEKQKLIEADKQNGNEKTTINVKDYYSPFLLSTTDFIVALTGVNSTCDDHDKGITVLTKYTVKESNKNWWENGGDGKSAGKWKTQLAAEKEIQCKSEPEVLKGFIAVTRKEKIYILLVNCYNNKGGSESNKINCDFEIHVGNVVIDASSKKKLSWEKLELPLVSNPYAVQSLSNEELQCKHPIFGTAFITKEEQIIFVVKAKSTEGEKKIAFVRSKQKKNEFEVVVNNDNSQESSTYIFPWNEKIIKVSSDCPENGKISITESTDTELKWSANNEPLSKLANFLSDKKDFFAVNSEREKFIFFTQEIRAGTPNGKLNLWISDGIRATKAGEITSNSQSTAPISFLYTNGELFLFAKTCGGSKTNNVCLTHLKGQTEQIKIVLNAWNTKTNKIKELCAKDTPKNIYCYTDGLVGFLSDTLNGSGNKEWKDEYYYKNIIVTGGVTKTDGGIMFTGKNANAQWHVGKEQNDQPYDFNKFGFTLVTMVTINKEVKESINYNSILGVSIAGNAKTIGLWCNKKGQWVVSNGKDTALPELTSENCEIGTTYQIIFIYEPKKKMAVYINETQLINLTSENIEIIETNNIEYFYFGVNKEQNDVETYVTIQNVLLYNRPFSDTEIVSLTKKDTPLNIEKTNDKESIAEQQSDGNSDGLEMTQKTVKSGDDGGELIPDTPTEEVVPSSTQQRESAVGNNVNSVNVGMLYLLFVLICRMSFY